MALARLSDRLASDTDLPVAFPATEQPLNILLLEDSDIDAELLIHVLSKSGMVFVVSRTTTRDEFMGAISRACHQLILADYALPSFDGLSALAIARERCPDVPFIFVSGVLGEDIAVEAMREGASDYVIKQKLGRLPQVIARVLGEAKAHVDRRAAEEALRLLNETLELRVKERTHELACANAELRRQIGERERVEGVLHQSQRLEAVGQLTSGIAHDFNNLLTVISGSLEILERKVTDGFIQRRLLMMREATDRGARLTAQMLAFSRRQKLKPTPVQLNTTVSSMRDLLQSSIGGAVRIATMLQESLWPAMVDATQIELVILNLAINARDAMAVGGCLTIETANVELTQAPARPEEPPPGDYVMVSVTDTGTGIQASVLERVFEPFFTTKEVGKGSGLGLAQVYGFAKQSGGGVRIETRIGEGTAVKVYLPRVAASVADKFLGMPIDSLPPEVSTRSADKPVLLVVDDDSAVRNVTATMLSEAGFCVREAGSGVAAVQLLKKESRVDLVVLDFAMPGMNGAEVATEVRRRWPRIPILFLTGYADVSALTKVDDFAMSSIVQKPFREHELLHKVSQSLGPQGLPRLKLVSDRLAVA